MAMIADEVRRQLRPWHTAPRWWLALSGGLDSTCLLHIVAALSPRPPLHAIHVNHGLSAHADAWQAHCAAMCKRLDVAFSARAVAPQPAGQGLEAAARAARYAVFEGCLEPGELLLLAHHADDQVETFFLRLMRGAGTRGLAGMPRSRALGAGTLLRPLLDCTRADLQAYAAAHGIEERRLGEQDSAERRIGERGGAEKRLGERGSAEQRIGEQCLGEQGLGWLEDDSNSDEGLDRNYLRRRVLPLLEARWPKYLGSVRQSMAALGEAEAALADIVEPLLEQAAGECLGEPTLDLAVFDNLADGFPAMRPTMSSASPSGTSSGMPSDTPHHLPTQPHSHLQPPPRGWLLRMALWAWCRRLGVEPPGRAKLGEFARQLGFEDGDAAASAATAADNAIGSASRNAPNDTSTNTNNAPNDTPNNASKTAPRLHLGAVCLERFRNRLHLRSCAPPPAGEWQLRPGQPLHIPGMGEVWVEASTGGLRPPAAGTWQVRVRAGGERCQPAGAPHRRSLKQLLHERGLPPWWRARLPLLYDGGALAAVADICVCEGFAAAPGDAGYTLRWRPNP